MDSLLQTFGEIIDRGAEDMNAAELMESERKFDDAVDRAVAEAYVGIFRIKYAPTRAKIRSGDHAANDGGNWLMSPMASNSRDTTV